MPSVFVLFNACDLTGRIIAGLPPWNHKPPRMPLLVLYCLARVPLAGGLLLCKVVTASAWRLPVLFRCCILLLHLFVPHLQAAH